MNNPISAESRKGGMIMGEEIMACPLTRGERILVALDGSIYSEQALDHAISMGTICNSVLFAIHVVEAYPKHMEAPAGFEDKVKKEAMAFLEKIKARADKSNVRLETILHVGGQPHQYIVKEAKERNVDLIVMGTHGRTGLKKLFLGSVAQKVIGHAPCAVLVVPAFPS
jgi:nucleotide-binding universal stress UspA family protein